MRRRAVVLLSLLAVVLAVLAAGADARPRAQRTSAFYLATALKGLADVRAHWWDAQAGWYYDTLDRKPASMPLARLWTAYPVFETLIGVAVARPTAANRAALARFATAAASLYWNPDPRPYGGYEWYPHLRGAHALVYFDDSGWWGISFVDAYAATHDPAYLTDARRALEFIVGTGWNPNGGGTWWDTEHHHTTIEPLAAALLVATRLYEAQHRPADLRTAQKLLAWADAHSFNAQRGLYQRSATDGTVMDYVEGLMTTANRELCGILHRPALCARARSLADAALVAFPHDLDWSPSYDVIYLRWMLQYYRESGDARWYALAADNAERVLATRDAKGLYLKRWDGRPLDDALIHDAASLELFAWLAATPAPAA